MATIRLKTVELAQLNFRHRFRSNIVQVGRISPKLAQKKPTMGRIAANLDEIRPKSVAEIRLLAFDRF
jgi:hypothetical protein